MQIDKLQSVGEKIYKRVEEKYKSLDRKGKKYFKIEKVLSENELDDEILTLLVQNCDKDLIGLMKNYACEVQKKKTKNNVEHFTDLYSPYQIETKDYPQPATLIKINFTLKTPYISRDDNEFYFMDNPVIKEKVYRVPMVRATGWKGMLRHSCFQSFWQKHKIDIQTIGTMPIEDKQRLREEDFNNFRFQLLNLFGTENDWGEMIWNGIYADLGLTQENFLTKYKKRFGEKNEGLQGRLYFYPTFFDNGINDLLDYQLINPHDRKYRFSKNGPILIEAVPKDAKGVCQVFYFPYDIIHQLNQGDNLKDFQDEIMNDLQLLLEGLYELLTNYGISAKTKAGYGKCVIDDLIIESNYLNTSFKKLQERCLEEWKVKSFGQ